ncbi:hypothetical protein PF002_g9302 [Phytophthora fragariae]|uniref:RxLR effector protein n=2 Tax=Phytophthora fragariae TaxID=53985 RepID=A0A6A3UKA8_9STRA|nr:hypothetical protein PF009_g8494 [Phytophthora fragariae]KAE9119968.1 hypothetical protein PF007_g8351 [Phytophthora fragariae]KAE9147468.1 hypothetical protein PF006_g7857 [Phytophthora fragariae]KAE9241392.1 hypothetical protein PF002_g9302 [Phytophthora fragariae]KAE9316708.1 hypothetical protein PF001_g7200 [Phytophthora fragariae]
MIAGSLCNLLFQTPSDCAMRLSYALLVAVATFLVTSDAASTTGHSRVSSTTTNAVNRLHPTSRRHLRSYNMNDLEAEDEERFQIKLTKADLKKLKQMGES